MNRTAVQKAADIAAAGLRRGEGGLAIYKAAREYGLTTGEVCRELAARRKPKPATRPTWTPYKED